MMTKSMFFLKRWYCILASNYSSFVTAPSAVKGRIHAKNVFIYQFPWIKENVKSYNEHTWIVIAKRCTKPTAGKCIK